MTIKLISEKHQLYIDQGALNRRMLRKAIERAIDRKTKRDFYIFSPPGLGKTYTCNQVFAQKQIVPIEIKGNTSLFGFVVDLASIMARRDPSDHIYLFIDDCDNLLLNVDSVNTLKIGLDENKLVYNKQLSAQYNQLEEWQQEDLDLFRKAGRNGVEIPLDNLTIIWCSNYRLKDQTASNAAKSDNAYVKSINEEALRRRLNARDYDVRGDTLWGWIADCVLNETPPAMQTASREQLEQIVVWMFDNFNRLKEHNISFAEKLYEEMELDPEEYLTAWEFDYLINE
jgi:hypothetical protein